MPNDTCRRECCLVLRAREETLVADELIDGRPGGAKCPVLPTVGSQIAFGVLKISQWERLSTRSPLGLGWGEAELTMLFGMSACAGVVSVAPTLPVSLTIRTVVLAWNDLK